MNTVFEFCKAMRKKEKCKKESIQKSCIKLNRVKKKTKNYLNCR